MAELAVNPPKWPRTPHWPWSETVHSDDSYHSSPEVFTMGDVVITEKIDGGNTCLWNGEVYARSTGQPSHHGWMGMVRKHHAWKTLGTRKDVVLYGEDIFGIHSIEYDAVSEDETFYLFGARYINPAVEDGGRSWFADQDLLESLAKEINVPTVPVLYRGGFRTVEDLTNWCEINIQQPSILGGEREGFVIKRDRTFDAEDFSKYVCKYVRENHVQTDEHWTRNWKSCKLK